MWIEVIPSQASLTEPDSATLAQFYLRPNPFYFVDPASVAPSGPLGLKLERLRQIQGVAQPTVIYPDPEGSLAMAATLVEAHGDDGFKAAYDVISPLLDELSLQYDQPLSVVQTLLVGVPSGKLTISFSGPSKQQTISPNSPLLPRRHHTYHPCRSPPAAPGRPGRP